MTIDRKIIWQEAKDYFNITLGLMLYTFGFTVFLLPYEIVTGGIAGIGAIVFYATKFPVQWTFFIINALLIVAALKELGIKFLAKTIYATIAITVMLDLAQKIVEMPDGTFYKLMGEGNDFMSLIIGCMLTGTALAVVFLNNGSTGGTHHRSRSEQILQRFARQGSYHGRPRHHRQLSRHRLFRSVPAALPDGSVRSVYDVHRM